MSFTSFRYAQECIDPSLLEVEEIDKDSRSNLPQQFSQLLSSSPIDFASTVASDMLKGQLGGRANSFLTNNIFM